MTYEFKKILKAYKEAESKNIKTVLASVVLLKGSSYRKPGVRMLIDEEGKMTGAVSGGCVEKEVLRQADSVFKTGIAKVMIYDGRYRLGCDGKIYILIEIFKPSVKLVRELEKCFNERKYFTFKSWFKPEFSEDKNYGSEIIIENVTYSIKGIDTMTYKTNYQYYKQILEPVFKLIIVGGEHDVFYLSKTASNLGWEVEVVLSLSDIRTASDYPDADRVLHVSASQLMKNDLPKNTAVILMTHNYAIDLKFLKVLSEKKALEYLGILGSVKRKEALLNELIESNPEINDDFLSKIYAPVGLDLGAETPEEIALSICAEILSVSRKRKPDLLRLKPGSIHSFKEI